MLIKARRIAAGITENSELHNMDPGSRLRSSASTVNACKSWPISKDFPHYRIYKFKSYLKALENIENSFNLLISK